MRRICLSFFVLIFLVWVNFCAAEESYEQIGENTLLALVLQQSFSDGGVTVVKPMASLSHLDLSDQKKINETKKYILEHIKVESYDIGPLVDMLFDRNKGPVRLTLRSSPRSGYLIDYQGEYSKYFEKGGVGWERWYKENPKAYGYTEISLPAYDPKVKVLLVYRGAQSHWLAGAGHIIAYKYEQGKLKELGRVMMWIP